MKRKTTLEKLLEATGQSVPAIHKTFVLPVNAQEGLIMGENNHTIFAFYSHHNAIIIATTPWGKGDFQIPPIMQSYEVTRCAHLSITGWADDGDRCAYWFKERNKAIASK
jgi:hypothetical protein